MGRIGIYGGTFNPPHKGHILAAQQAVSALQLDKLLLIPDRIAPHKEMPEDSGTPQQRLEMLQKSVDGIAKCEVSDLELSREGKSYTYETILELKKQYPADELILLMGTDMFLFFDSWKHPEIILGNAALGVLYRGDAGETAAIEEKKAEMEAGGAKILLVKNEVFQISSTDLRRMLVFGCADSYLPAGVGEYIRNYGLYGTNENYRNLPVERLEQAVVSLLNPNRIAHVLGCRDMAVALAKRWGADETAAARAALLHDVTKALPAHAQLTLCREYGKMLDAFSLENPKVLHALTGSLVADRIFGESDEVVQAICWHTTGRPYMGLLEKIIYIADYTEPNRTFPAAKVLREVAFEDLDEAVRQGLNMTISLLQKQGGKVAPMGLQALAWFNGERKDETKC